MVNQCADFKLTTAMCQSYFFEGVFLVFVRILICSILTEVKFFKIFVLFFLRYVLKFCIRFNISFVLGSCAISIDKFNRRFLLLRLRSKCNGEA